MKQSLLLYSENTFETRGAAKAPCLTFRIQERMFHVIFALGSELMFQGTKVARSKTAKCSRERKYQGAKVPPMVLSLLGAICGNESSSYRPIYGLISARS